MARPVAQYLAEFGLPPHFETMGGTSHDSACLDLADTPVAEAPGAAIQAAREEGISEGYAAARAEYEAQLPQERLAYEARLADERESWTRQESEKLSENIKALFAKAESNIADSIEQVLRPFVIDSLRRRMIDLLAENVGILLGGNDCASIEIHGPEDLLGLLREKLPELAGMIGYFPGESIDVRIVAGQTMIESRIGAWLERIKSLPE